jgi:hypothetical protein
MIEGNVSYAKLSIERGNASLNSDLVSHSNEKENACSLICL